MQNWLHARCQQPPCLGRAAAEGVNCFRFVGIQICQPEGGTDHQINHLSGTMAGPEQALTLMLFVFSLANCIDCVWLVSRSHSNYCPGLGAVSILMYTK